MKYLNENPVQKTYFVVTGVLEHDNRFLILKKSADDYNYPNHWSFCSGYVKEFESAEETILREIKEETGLKAQIIKTGKIVVIPSRFKDCIKRWVVAVFLCKTNSNEIRLCHENQDYKWVKKEELKDFKFVPGLADIFESLDL